MPTGLLKYDAGEFDAARKLLESALKEGLKDKADQVRAMKYIAFTECLEGKYKECRAEFIKIYDVDPNFDLTPAEAGHPSWTHTFAAAKATAKRALAGKAGKETKDKAAGDKAAARAAEPFPRSDSMISTLGRYKIIAEIGQGAMGVVYKAVDPIIDRTVAIKTINLNLSRQELEEYEARFQQEIKAAGRLNHPNIVTIYDVGKTESVAYMAMEFLEGQELKDMIAAGNLPSADAIVDIIAQVADGLWFAHQQDIVHRDVKPSNIMVLKGGIAKITDFGIARLPNSAVKTMTGLILGSPRYMSPEQVIGKAIDARSDIFSLGVVLYEALTGIAPFDGDNVNAIMYATVNTTPPPPSSHSRSLPPMLDLICAKAMAKLLEDRYQTIKEFGDDLREVRRQIDSTRPAAALKATTAPPSAPRASAPIIPPERMVDTATIPLNPGDTAAKDDDSGKALALAKTFDSFDATLRLAAMTDQTEDFRDYITATQKMRAYKGKIEAGSPLAPKAAAAAPASAPAPAPAPAEPAKAKAKPAARPAPAPAPARAEREETMSPSPGSNMLAMAAIVVLALAAIGLTIALLLK